MSYLSAQALTPSSSSAGSSGTATPTPGMTPTPRAPLLKVSTDMRARSNSTQSPVASRFFVDPSGTHQPSRSFSHAPGLAYASGVGAGAGSPGLHVGSGAPSPVHALRPHSPAAVPMSHSQTLPHPVVAGAHRGVPAHVSVASAAHAAAADSVTAGLTPVELIQHALAQSPDRGETLDLSRSNLERVTDEVIAMFRRGVGKDRKGVWRLALSYNLLQNDSLAASFSQLNRLRYLNLKGNLFTEFPLPLLDLPALEILDLSKNTITTFPAHPGTLTHLKVLSLSHNAIYTLPAYLVGFIHLKVFKVDGNPIEWPVLGPLIEPHVPRTHESGERPAKKEEDLRPWIENMKSWMRTRTTHTDRLLERNRAEEEAYLASEEEPTSAVSTVNSGPYPWKEPGAMKKASDSPAGLGSPAHHILAHRHRAATISADSLLRADSSTLSLPSQSSRHDRSASSSSLTPPVSASTASSSRSHPLSASHAPPAVLPPPPPPSPPHAAHTRGSSYNATQRLSAQLTAKKSLPDLRLSHAKIIENRRDSGGGAGGAGPSPRALGLGIATKGSRYHLPGKSWGENQIARAALSPVRAGSGAAGGGDDDFARMARAGSVDPLRRGKAGGGGCGAAGADLLDKRGSQDGPEMDESRNSYFRRLSMLPASTISKAVSPALLRFVDAIRGVLFALTQLHSALRQFLVFAVSDRVAGVFARVMEPASGYLATLINALDRFDSGSRRAAAPPAHAVRAVVDAAKESTAVFAKVVAVLKLQLAALRDTDVRYTRQLLLNIYGSMAEVACSWKTMAPLLIEMRPLLAAVHTPAGGQKMVASLSLTGRTPISPIPERGESHSPESVARAGSTSATAPSPLHQVLDSPAAARAAKSRRQAGSFSTQDLERGMLMGSPGVTDTMRRRPSEADMIAEQPETPSETHTQDTFPSSQVTSPPEPHDAAMAVAHAGHAGPATGSVAMQPSMSQRSTATSRRGHLPSSSAGSSHALSSYAAGYGGGAAPSRKLSVDVRPPTPASATLFDDDLLDIIETATDVAFSVWLRLAEEIGSASPPPPPHKHGQSDSTGSGVLLSRAPYTPTSGGDAEVARRIPARTHAELVSLLSQAEQITAGLRESMMALRADPHSYARATLADDAQAFIKTVIRVSELVKAISAHHAFGAQVRLSLSRLTQATRECAILMQVSSLRPGSTTPAPAMASARAYGPASSMDDLSATSAAHVHHPHHHHYTQPPPVSASWAEHGSVSLGGGTAARDGLRGLQLPSRQAALGRQRERGQSTNSPPSADPATHRFARDDSYTAPLSVQPPRSAQASQAAF